MAGAEEPVIPAPVIQVQEAPEVIIPVGDPGNRDPLGLQQQQQVPIVPPAPAVPGEQPGPGQGPLQAPPPVLEDGEQGAVLNAQEVAEQSHRKVAELEETVRSLKNVVNTLSQTAAAAGPAVVKSSGVVAKTTIKTPELASGMTFRDYCFEVNSWRHYAGQHIAKKDMAWLLLNHMPATDERMIKKTIIERIGWTDLAKDDAVDKLLEEMQKIVECEPFTRLVEWLKGWETLEQGSKSYDKYTSSLRKMSKSALDDFGFKIPQALLVAKLFYGCRDVQGSNIGLITAGLNLNGQDDDRLYETVEAKVKSFIGTTDAYNRIKSSQPGHSHKVHYTAKDVFNKPLHNESPEKSQLTVPSLTNKAADDEEYQAFIAFKAKKAGGGAKKSSQETREERRERLIGEGRCFELNCESKSHVYEDCPKKKQRLMDRKRQVEEAGGTWYDNPEEAKKARLQQRLGPRPPHRNHIQFECKDDEVVRDISDDDNVVMDELDEAQATRMFGTSNIFVTSRAAKEYNIGKIGTGPHIHSINYARIRKDEALADSGCERGCSGPEAYEAYLESLSEEDRKLVKEFPGSARFKFGGDGIFTSQKEVIVPFYIAGNRKFLRMDVVQADVPILLGLPAMKQLRLGFQYDVKGQQDFGFFEGQKFKVYHKSGHHYIRISREGSLEALVPNEEANRGDNGDDDGRHFSAFITKVNVFDDDKIVSQLKQLHTNYAHLPQKKMIQVIKDAGQWKPEMQAIISSLMAKCPVKSCRTREMTQANAKADFRTAKRLGDAVSVDLKIRSSGKSIMYLIDTATSYAVAGLISDKTSQECGRVLIRGWYGTGMPRIQKMISDNGKEWLGDEFQSVLRRFSTVRKFTTPYHPQANGMCERVHSIVDINMQKLMEEDSSLDDESALIWALTAYNSTPTYTGFSPNQMVFGIQSVLTPVQDLSPVECQEEDSTSRYLKDLKAREDAITNHNVIRNSRKLRDMLLGRSRPTVEPKEVGTWVWYCRRGDWRGPGQVATSLQGECAVKDGNNWYTCRHNETLPLTDDEINRHGLNRAADHIPRLEHKVDPVTPQIIELEVGMQEILQTVPASRPSDVQPKELVPEANRLGSGTRRSSGCAEPAAQSSEPASDLDTTAGIADSQSATPQEDRSDAHTRVVGLEESTPEKRCEVQNGQAEADQAGTTGQSAGVVTQGLDNVDTATNDSGQASTQHVGEQPPEGFDPNFLNRPAVNVRDHPLKKNQEVRIVHPKTKETIDVTVCNGFKRKNEKSWYRVSKPDGKKEIFDFDEIVWDHKATRSLFCKKARINPNKPYIVNHTVIHPKFHNQPQVLEAKAAEIKNHEKFGTFEMTKLSELSEAQRAKIIPSVWAVVYKGTRPHGKYKARWCARGDLEPNVDMIRTDAPTASKDSIRVLLSFAASTGWKLHSLDFQAAFIQGKTIDRELYLNPPSDVRKQNPGYVLKVVKRIYGLKDASRGWCTEIGEFLQECGMTQSSMDKAVYFQKNKAGEVTGLIITHIDDFLYVGSEEFHDQVIKKILKKYVIGAQEDTEMTFTGWELKQTAAGIELTQDSYCDAISLQKYDHFRAFTAKDDEKLDEIDQGNYRKMVGTLGWLTNSSKPALAHVCNMHSTKLGKASKADAKALLRILEKAKAEPEVIKFSNIGPPKNWKLDIFCDAALGRNTDPDTYVGDIAFLMGNGKRNVLNWSATKLDIPTASILVGEADSVTSAYGKISYFRYILEELFGFQAPATIHTDSKSLHATVHSDNTIRNRRISAAVATIRAVKMKDNICLSWVKGIKNLSDPLTKPNANAANLKHVLRTGETLPNDDAKINEIDFTKLIFLE